jgi:P27 family predicted phage terminase small subunit
LKEVKAPAAPAHLSKEARSKWDRIVADWIVSAADLMILQGGLEAWDQHQECRRLVAEQGVTFTTETGMIRVNPAVKVGLDSFAAFRQSWRQLGLQPEE